MRVVLLQFDVLQRLMDAFVDGMRDLRGIGGTEFSGMKRKSLSRSNNILPSGSISKMTSRYSSTLRKMAKTSHFVHNRSMRAF
jgi:hypothetical protein